uniref:Putative galactose-3-o-sulfotransferase n=1 Tax=Amblyomma aureolatum TaxID=187763 RepID=A0A1E1XE35_9ACAR
MLRHFHRALVTCMVFLCVSLVGILFVTTRSRMQQRYANSAQALTENASSPHSSCEPRINIVFLKTHKCASSTVMNIFLRFGTEHGLNFVLPKSPNTHYLGHPEPFSRRFIANISAYNMTYNILTHHTRYNGREMHELMPPDTVYVTILRRPDSLFESLYSYCKLETIFKRNLTVFVRDRNLTGYLARHRVIERRVGLNQMSFDLGFNGPPSSREAVVKFLEDIGSAFDLVMLAERLDESLVLLKHLLCWNTTDMVALKVNSRYSAYKEKLSNDTKQRILNLNPVDWQLYEHFAKLFDDKVKEFGEDRMAEEVEELRAAQKEYYERCVKAEESMEKVSPYYKRKDVVAFKAKDHSKLCRSLTLTELEFHEVVKKVQEAKIKTYLSLHKSAHSTKRAAKDVAVAARTFQGSITAGR